MSNKVLIIGIDGGTWTILHPAIEAGSMPYIKSMIDSAVSGTLQSTIPAITPAAWGSFQTGMNPGENGVFDFYRWDKNQNKCSFVSSHDLQRTIWTQASQAGKRVAVLNVPMTYPPHKINGYMVTGVLTPSLESEFTYPADFKTELLNAVPDYSIINLEVALRKPAYENFETYLEQMTKALDHRAQIACHLINKESFDLFMVHFHASDLIQHALWGYMDQTHPLYDPDKRRYIFDNFYSHLDRKVQQVHQLFQEKAGSNCLTFVVSDHGFQAHRKKFNLEQWFHQQGFLKIKPAPPRRPPAWPVRLAKKLGLGKLLRPLLSQDTVAQIELSLKLKDTRFDLEHSRAYPRWSCGEGFIYLLEDDEKLREATTRELTEKLSQIKDPQNDTPIVAAVHRKEQIYSGRRSELMPDLVIDPADGYSFAGHYQPHAELLKEVNLNEDLHLGKHHKDGILIATGVDLTSPQNIAARITDIAPTVLYYLHLPVPENMTGRVLTNLFKPEYLEQHPLDKLAPAASDTAAPDESYAYSADDEETIENRLKNLGYL